MIHQAAEMMVVDRFGERTWREICKRAGVTSEFFIGFDYYPDELTMALLQSITEHLEASLEEVLFEFGSYWVKYAKASAYGRAMDMAGDNLTEFFQQLDRMHSAITSNLPKSDMPSFSVANVSPGGFELRYRSSRHGLQPFVHGLIIAIARSFGEIVEVRYETLHCGADMTVRRTGVAKNAEP